MQPDDAQLMLRVQAGDLESFEVLVRRYRAALQRFAVGKLGDAAKAEDLVQETFLAVYASRDTFNPRFAFRTWLWTILWNLCRREIARRARKPKVHFRTPQFAGTAANAVEPATPETGLSNLLLGERSEHIAELLEQLPETQADAIRLRFFGGLKYSEIAHTMGSAEITAKVRVRKGLAALADRLRDATGETP